MKILQLFIVGFLFLSILNIDASAFQNDVKPATRKQKKAWKNNVPGTVIAHQPAASKQYIGSPSICILPNGDYVASHDFFGPESSEFVQAVSRIYRSTDRGASWKQISEINGAFWSKLFVSKGVLYFLGPDRHHGSLLIRRSDDGGKTWTIPRTKNTGLLLAGEYHCAPMPVIIHRGRIWRAMETAHGPVREWGKRYGAFMMSAPVDADLLKASSWTSSNSLLYNPDYLNGNFGGWLEGNAVVTRNGEVLDILRVSDKTTLDEKAAVVRISEDGKTASFDPETGFQSFPGGSKKFSILFDKSSGLYWTLCNYIPKKKQVEYAGRNSASIRNTLALMSSTDLKNWELNKILLEHSDVVKHGFQYVDWLFDGDDIIFASRTAFEDGLGGAHNNHDANFLTFHRIRDFRAESKKKLDY